MSERNFANKVRIQIIEQIADIDLPGFLFEHLDQNLSELNYFKLTNLMNNIDSYTKYLINLAQQYSRHILSLQGTSLEKPAAPTNYEPFMTEELYQKKTRLSLSKKQLIKVRSLFSVSCLLTMKEFINRRILQSTPMKPKAMRRQKALIK